MLPGGDDWAVRRAGGVIELDLCVTLPRFETAEPKYSFLNRLRAVGTAIHIDGPVHIIEELL